MRDLSHLLEFETFVAVHAEFFESFWRHQEALVRGDADEALAEITQLQTDLADHIRRENDVILPVLESRGGWTRAGDPRFYREEHGRIAELLERYRLATSMLRPGEPGYPRAAAQLIGSEQTLKTLLEHHDDRESRCLYPDLLRVTTPEERAQMLRA